MPVNDRVQRCPVSREQASHRILIMRAGAFGDILMATPLLSALRLAFPAAHLTWIAEHKEVQAIDANPFIDEYLRWDGSYWKKMLRRGLFPLWLLRALRFQKVLRARRFDVFISFQPEEWPLLIQASGAKMSIGVFDTFRQFENRGETSRHVARYTHSFAEPELPPHRTDQFLLPLRALGLPEPADKQMQMGFTADDAETAETFLRQHGIETGQPFAVLAPMTTWPSRCWPAERYAALGDRLASKIGGPVVLIGSARPTEQEAIAGIMAQMQSRPIRAAGVLSFRQMAALIARASVLVSGDTGPMHVAAAVGTPFVALFGPTPAQGRAPLAGRGEVLQKPVPCGPCDQKLCPNKGADYLLCLKRITVEEAEAATLRVLAPLPGRV